MPLRDGLCPSCIQYRRRLAGAHARSRHLQTELQKTQALLARAQDRIRELEQPRPLAPAEAKLTACNSSLPPSANPIGAPRPVVKKPTGKRPGGQIGHRGAGRKLLPLEKMDHVVEHRPVVCRHCHHPLDAHGAAQLVGRHQVAELPRQAVTLTEHQSYICRCDHCGKMTREMIPAEIALSTTGPRLTAAIGILSAWVKGSRRAVMEVISRILGGPMALGSISARERELKRCPASALCGTEKAAIACSGQICGRNRLETAWAGPLAVRGSRQRQRGIPDRKDPYAPVPDAIIGGKEAGHDLLGSLRHLRSVAAESPAVVLGASEARFCGGERTGRSRRNPRRALAGDYRQSLCPVAWICAKTTESQEITPGHRSIAEANAGSAANGGRLRTEENDRVMQGIAETGKGVVAIRDHGGNGPDEQSGGADVASCCDLAKEEFWEPQPGGLPVCGANVERDSDVEIAPAGCFGLSVSSGGIAPKRIASAGDSQIYQKQPGSRCWSIEK
jgi:hypothetical protein